MVDKRITNFHALLTQLSGGALAEELSEEMRKCVQEIQDACMDRAGSHKASLTLKLDFVMNHKDKVCEIYPEVVTKMPKAPKGRAGMYFTDEDGNFTRENPRQLTLDDELERKRLRDIERQGMTEAG